MPDDCARLMQALHFQRGGFLDRALDEYRAVASSSAEPALVSEAFRREASVHRNRCHWTEALDAARLSADAAKNAGLNDLLAEAFNAEALIHLSRGDLDDATLMFERVLRTTADPRILGNTLQNLGTIAATRGDFSTADQLFADSVLQFRRVDHTPGIAIALNNQGRIALDQGQFDRAEPLLLEAAFLARSGGDADLSALATLNLAEALLARGRFADAESHASTALGHFTVVGNDWRRAECFRLLGDLRAQQNDLVATRRCYELGLGLARTIGAKIEAGQLAARLAALPMTA